MFWIVYKFYNGKIKYVSGTDEFGYPIHTENEKDAFHFYNFDVAMSFFDLGYCISKQYVWNNNLWGEIMIDFKTKTLFFGYGDILVNHSIFGLIFVECEPPIEVGTCVTEKIKNELNIKLISDIINIYIETYEEAMQLRRLLNNLDGKDCCQFVFKGYRFNFFNWNVKSVESVKRHLDFLIEILLIGSAC